MAEQYKPHDKSHRNHIVMENGLLDLEAVLRNDDVCLQKHTPLWFSETLLPYNFDPIANCPKWINTLHHNLEHDMQRINLLQEWAGYLLTRSTDEQKFLALEGEGSNGKSVFLAGVTAMLGPDNVTHVPLELFGQRFALTTTLGKKANIAGDCGELDKVAEGHLKTFTGGEPMQFDRKGLPPVTESPTARMMMAFNNRPRFSDKSGGLWRRMILVPFRIEISKEMRVKGMDKAAWWLASDECPGIFNWAIAGLARMRLQGGFSESAICNEAIEDYKTEVNPAKSFLQECCEEAEYESVEVKKVYANYKKWCSSNGYRPLGERQFGKEVYRQYPKVKRVKAGTRADRTWNYAGLSIVSLIGDDEF